MAAFAIALMAALISLSGGRQLGVRSVAAAQEKTVRTAPAGLAKRRAWKSPEKMVSGEQKAKGVRGTAAASDGGNALVACVETPITLNQTLNGALTSDDCLFQSDNTFYDIYAFTGTAGQQVSVAMSSSAFDTYLFLVYDDGTDFLTLGENDDISDQNANSRIPISGVATLPYTGDYFILANSFSAGATGNYSVTLSGGGTCPTAPITLGQPVSSSISVGDCKLPDETFFDYYTFSGAAGQQVAISMSASFDTYLFLVGPNGRLLAFNDDVDQTTTNSRIPVSGFLTLPSTGTYSILANTFSVGATGAYTLSLTGSASSSPSVQLSSSSYAVSEGTPSGVPGAGVGVVQITVTRTGDTAGESFVNYATTDGTASERKDYLAALGRIRFGPGETTKTFDILITDDAFAEGPETFNVTLSNAVGSTLGATSSAVVNINSNDGANGPSPVKDASFNTEFFVRQQYADFLNRIPDTSGLNFWINNIESCGADQACRAVRRVDTSAAFFLSIEFQETGYLVYRTHKAAFGNLAGKPVPIVLRDFLSDTRRIGDGVVVGVGNWQQQLEANKVAYFTEFVTRTAFTNAYPLTQTAAQYVDALFQKAGVVPTAGERQAAINAFGAGGTAGRAAALRSVAESETLRAAEFNRAFVLLQYIGYLRRDPDAAPDSNFDGYNFWLGKLNQFNGDFRAAEMVRAFISSIEYTERFGQ
jgi:hypothetical protein